MFKKTKVLKLFQRFRGRINILRHLTSFENILTHHNENTYVLAALLVSPADGHEVS